MEKYIKIYKNNPKLQEAWDIGHRGGKTIIDPPEAKHLLERLEKMISEEKEDISP